MPKSTLSEKDIVIHSRGSMNSRLEQSFFRTEGAIKQVCGPGQVLSAKLSIQLNDS